MHSFNQRTPASHQAASVCPLRRTRDRRKGSIIIECVVSALVLASCGVALLKWTRASTALSRKADIRLANQLIADNAAERLENSSITDAVDKASQIATELTTNHSVPVVIRNDEFIANDDSSNRLRGIHFTIEVSQDDASTKTTRHAWIFDTPPSKPEAPGPPAEKIDQPNPDNGDSALPIQNEDPSGTAEATPNVDGGLLP